MEKLIQALQIFLKYSNPEYPTHCEHDELMVNISPLLIPKDEILLLEELGFYAREDEDVFYSYRYGSC